MTEPRNRWPVDKLRKMTGDTRSPLQVIVDQMEFLNSVTGGLIGYSLMKKEPDPEAFFETRETWVVFISPSGHENKYKLLEVRFEADLVYPCGLSGNGLSREGPEGTECYSATGLEENLEVIFRSPQTQGAVQSLIIMASKPPAKPKQS